MPAGGYRGGVAIFVPQRLWSRRSEHEHFCRIVIYFLIEVVMQQRISPSLLAIALLALVAACGIPEEQHDDVLDELEQTQIDLAETERDKDELEETLTNEINALDDRVEELHAENDELQDELEEARGDIDLYESRAGSLEESLEANRQELDELREARRQTEERLDVYREVAEQLAGMIEAGQLSVDIREGRMVINLDDDILFDSGRTAIKSDGQTALEELAEILDDIEEREFLIAGHTDNIPISSSRFDSNWELSTARAVEVVRFLQDEGVPPRNLVAAGYGEHDPIASNDEAETRALNRRIEIVLMPSIDELPDLPDDVIDERETASQ